MSSNMTVHAVLVVWCFFLATREAVLPAEHDDVSESAAMVEIDQY